MFVAKAIISLFLCLPPDLRCHILDIGIAQRYLHHPHQDTRIAVILIETSNRQNLCLGRVLRYKSLIPLFYTSHYLCV